MISRYIVTDFQYCVNLDPQYFNITRSVSQIFSLLESSTLSVLGDVLGTYASDPMLSIVQAFANRRVIES